MMYKNYLLVSIFLFFFFVVFLVSSAIADERYDSCPPTNSSCGFHQLKYPFWDTRLPDYCGHPSFKLDCDNNSLTINIEDQTYLIYDINYVDKVFTLAKPQLLTGPCPDNKNLLTNTTLDPNLFGLTSNSQNATLFYGCLPTRSDPDPPYGFRCSVNELVDISTNSDIGYLAVSGNKLEQDLRNNCSFEVQLPILKTEAVKIANGASNVEQLLMKGFEVKWMIDDNGQCADCKKSEGRCGFNQTLKQTTCFCDDGGHGSSCNGLHNHTLDPADSPIDDLADAPTGKTQNRKIIIVVVGIIGTAAFIGIMYYLWSSIGRLRYGNKVTSKEIKTSLHCIIEDSGSESEFQDLPMLKFETLVVATNNFHGMNKLGQGGFGPVYKGTLENGKEVAIKRLSRASGQGQREFMNEVMVISKLQHKNLVRLLGCCAEGEEKLLVYEFMPNKSLDAFLFDPVHRELLDWKTRYGIIKGICRGVLYLHRDSRLKIIHRDLKASNILLDEELNPKISDFGMARIFGGKQDQANTLRVVGTYGYMSPEYAMDGRFSEKSDVFSLGVLLLEIVTGRRNGSIRDDSMSLISYAWKLWNEDEIHSLIDPTISVYEVEIVKSIHVGLLCVQEFPENRPSISSVISMLDCEVIDLPRPLQPGFTQWRTCPATDDAQEQYCSENLVSISSVHGR